VEARTPRPQQPRTAGSGGSGRQAFGPRPVPPRPMDRTRWLPPTAPTAQIATRPPVRQLPARGETATPSRYTPLPTRGGFGLPNLRRNVCPHFYMTGCRGAIPIQAPHLLKALIRQDQNVSRCQVRGGVHLEQGYVNDVCLTPRFNQCVFYEDDLTKD
jgi:hypothetical protein